MYDISKLKLVVNDPESWGALTSYFESEMESAHDKLSRADEEINIYRYQGEARCLRGLLKLRDRVNGQ